MKTRLEIILSCKHSSIWSEKLPDFLNFKESLLKKIMLINFIAWNLQKFAIKKTSIHCPYVYWINCHTFSICFMNTLPICLFNMLLVYVKYIHCQYIDQFGYWRHCQNIYWLHFHCVLWIGYIVDMLMCSWHWIHFQYVYLIIMLCLWWNVIVISEKYIFLLPVHSQYNRVNNQYNPV